MRIDLDSLPRHQSAKVTNLSFKQLALGRPKFDAVFPREAKDLSEVESMIMKGC